MRAARWGAGRGGGGLHRGARRRRAAGPAPAPGRGGVGRPLPGIGGGPGEEAPPPVRVGPSLVDMGSSLWAVIGILAALGRRRDTGEGAVVDVSLFETAAAWMGPYAVPDL